MDTILLLFFAIGISVLSIWFGLKEREKQRIARRDYYREYLKSDAWKRKRYVVLKRDNWTCRYCGAKATQVHHLKYAKYQIGKEPIKWLVSICAPCHRDQIQWIFFLNYTTKKQYDEENYFSIFHPLFHNFLFRKMRISKMTQVTMGKTQIIILPSYSLSNSSLWIDICEL